MVTTLGIGRSAVLLAKSVIDKDMLGIQRLNGYGLVVILSITVTGLRYSLACRETYGMAFRVLRLRGGEFSTHKK